MLTPLSLSSINLHITVSPFLLFGIMALLVATWGVFTLIIQYHWKNYGTSKADVFSMNFFYLVGSATLIIFMGIFALYYYASAT